MATLREQFEKSKKAMEMAEAALKDISAQLDGVEAYRSWREMRRLEKEALQKVRSLLVKAGVAVKDDAHFAQLRSEWTKHVKPLSEEWLGIDAAEGRLTMLKRQLSAISMRSFSNLLTDQGKARVAKAKCEADFRRLRDLVYRERQARQEQHQVAVVAAPDVVAGVLNRLDNPVRNRGRGRRRQKGADKATSGRPAKKERGTKAERRKQAMEAHAQG